MAPGHLRFTSPAPPRSRPASDVSVAHSFRGVIRGNSSSGERVANPSVSVHTRGIDGAGSGERTPLPPISIRHGEFVQRDPSGGWHGVPFGDRRRGARQPLEHLAGVRDGAHGTHPCAASRAHAHPAVGRANAHDRTPCASWVAATHYLAGIIVRRNYPEVTHRPRAASVARMLASARRRGRLGVRRRDAAGPIRRGSPCVHWRRGGRRRRDRRRRRRRRRDGGLSRRGRRRGGDLVRPVLGVRPGVVHRRRRCWRWSSFRRRRRRRRRRRDGRLSRQSGSPRSCVILLAAELGRDGLFGEIHRRGEPPRHVLHAPRLVRVAEAQRMAQGRAQAGGVGDLHAPARGLNDPRAVARDLVVDVLR